MSFGVLEPAEVESPEAVVRTLYRVISGPAEEERDWDRLRALFRAGARILVPRSEPDQEDGAEEYDGEDFVEEGGRFYRQDGFWEREIWSSAEHFRGIAHVLSTYESRVESPDSDPVIRGINNVQLLRQEGRWWIASIVFDVEGGGHRIPLEYLSDGGGTDS